MKKLLLITSFLFTLTFYAQNNPDFYLAPNGVTCLCPEAEFGDAGTLTINGEDKTLTKRTEAELRNLAIIDIDDPQIALTCTSGIADMNDLFDGYFVENISSFNQNLEHWDVSQVTDMANMFYNATSFNQALNSWDVSSVTNMRSIFRYADSFNQPLNDWDVSKVKNMIGMFSSISFNQPLNSWDVSSVTNMEGMFDRAASFNQPLNSWDVSNVTNMRSMFTSAESFDQFIDSWDVSNVSNMKFMFYGAESFDQPLNNWDVSNVTDMEAMFHGADSFNQPLNNWDVSQVTDMGIMFEDALVFNQPLDNWDVSQVTNMYAMFLRATLFNQDLSGWCVEQIPNEPSLFAFNSALQNDFFPNWGAECNLSTTNPEAIGFNILIYPNPSNSKVFIENDGQIILSKIKLIDMLGREIKIFSASQITHGLDVSEVDAGNYFIQFTTVDNQQFVKRLIVK